jgi:capsular polysaccharide biosynthesis protein
MSQMTSVEPPVTQLGNDQDFGFLDLLTMLGEEKWTVLAVTVIATMIGVVMSLVATPIFRSTAVIMPAQQSGGGSAAGALAQLAQVPGIGALGGLGGGKSSDQLYVALMRSQTIQDTLIKKHDLRKKWGSRSIEDARTSLSTAVSIGTDKQSGLINIVAKDPDPNFAAELANSHVAELHSMLERVATTEAQQRRMFYENQITKTQTNLSAAELRYRQAQESSGIQVTSMLAESALRTSTELRAKMEPFGRSCENARSDRVVDRLCGVARSERPDTQKAATQGFKHWPCLLERVVVGSADHERELALACQRHTARYRSINQWNAARCEFRAKLGCPHRVGGTRINDDRTSLENVNHSTDAEQNFANDFAIGQHRDH